MLNLRHLPTLAATLLAASLAVAENKTAISSEEIKQHVGYLASDALEGRGTASAGERKAAAYIAKQFTAYGIKPGAADGTFTQSFNVAGRTQLGPKPALQIRVGSS